MFMGYIESSLIEVVLNAGRIMWGTDKHFLLHTQSFYASISFTQQSII